MIVHFYVCFVRMKCTPDLFRAEEVPNENIELKRSLAIDKGVYNLEKIGSREKLRILNREDEV